jgi:hypothetical protein
MLRNTSFSIRLLVFVAAIFFFHCASAAAQPRRLEGPSVDRPNNEVDSESKFFYQLRSLFGRFRDGDLDRAFAAAQPIQCSELVSDNGEWRPVAFFNEDRRLGDWYHSTLDDVKRELSQYVFSGTCNSDRSNVRLVTKFPVMESVRRYNSGRIPFKEIHLNVNPAVIAYFEPRTQIYTFELPYLYIDPEKSVGQTVYSLLAARLDDRPAREVTNHWECKSVRAEDVTFQFLICQTWTMPSDAAVRKQSRPSFGSSAYFILSDGREASTSVKLSFGGSEDKGPPPEAPLPPPPPVSDAPPPDRPVTQTSPPPPPAETNPGRPGGWEVPDPSSKLAAVRDSEFRVIFSAQTWANKLASPQVLLDQRMLGLDAVKPAGADYCVWQPASVTLVSRVLGRDPDSQVAYTLTATSGDNRSPTFLNLDMKTLTGSRLGALQCFFPRGEAAESIPFSRWVSIVGAHLTIEVRP